METDIVRFCSVDKDEIKQVESTCDTDLGRCQQQLYR